MIKFKQRIANPMTIIAIFATLSEASAAVSLPFLGEEERQIYVWFLISFPFYLLFLFFATLNFNYRSLYAPSDFEKGKHFIKAMDNNERLESAQDPQEEIGSRSDFAHQPSVRLPETAKDLHIIDARRMSRKIDFRHLLEKIRQPKGNPAQIVVLLTTGESETVLKEGALKFYRSAKKRGSTPLCIAYNLSSQDITIIDRACDAGTQQSVAF